MHDKTEPIEHLISRRLDAALDDDEQLELDRALIRDPHAQRLMEETERVDELCAVALGSLFRDRGRGARPSLSQVRQAARRRAPRSSRWLIPGAIAAALLAMVVPFPDDATVSKVAPQPGYRAAPQVGPVEARDSADLYRNISVPRTRRSLGRDIFGVVAEDGNVYWIEVDRSRTVRMTPPEGRWQGTERM